jgi:5-methylcytosine-specific restriction enzyme subunit McrC
VDLQHLAGRTILRLTEWEHAELALTPLSEPDRITTAALAAGEGRLIVEELRATTRVRATSWIGVVRLQDLEIRVEPKYVGGNLGVVEMLDYTNGFGSLARFPAVRDLAVGGASLFDLIALLLAEECRRLARDGLLQDYVSHEETLQVVRGRLRPLEQITKHYGRVDALECRFDEFETDIDENRLLSAALEFAAPRCRDGFVRNTVMRMRSVFQEVCLASSLDWGWVAHPPDYHRQNEHYRVAHEYARLILNALAVRDIFQASTTTSFTFLLDMNVLFERFATRLLADGLAGSGLRVISQRRDRSIIIEEASGRGYRAVIPDMLIVQGSHGQRRRIPVDAKYKLYQEGKIEPPDIYQLFFYAYAFDRVSTAEAHIARAFMLYPSTDAWHHVQLRAQTSDASPTARLVGWGVDVKGALRAINEARVPDLPFVASIREALN